jgi:chromosome segregation ATPase
VKYWNDRTQSTLYLSASAVEELKTRGVNISAIVNQVLIELLKSEYSAKEYVTLATLKARYERLELTERELTEKLEGIGTIKKRIQNKMKDAQRDVNEMEEAERINEMIRDLNKKIRESDYDLKRTKESAREVIEKLQDIGLTLSDDWLNRQITRLQTIGQEFV